MANPPLVSILIPTYNQSQFIRDAIASALLQDYPNLEIVVGDDSSSDGTDEVVRSFTDSRVRYVRNVTNIGRVRNYKRLLETDARGVFVVNLDGDDYFTDPTFLSRAVELFSLHGDAVIVSARARRESSNTSTESVVPNLASAAGLEVLSRLPDPHYFFMHLATVYRRESAISIDFYRFDGLSCDYESLYRLALRGHVYYMDRVVGTWRIHNANETATTSLEPLLRNLEVWRPIYADAIRFGLRPMVARSREARCVAAFIRTNCATISRQGNSPVTSFLLSCWARHRLSFFYLLISPRSIATLALAYLGYFRLVRR